MLYRVMLHSKKRDVTLMGNISKKFLFSVCCNCVASLCQFDTFLRLPQIVKHSNYKPSSVLKLVRDYRFENWLALLAFLRPYFFLSFILESLVRNPAALSAGLYASLSASHRALEIPCLKAPA